MMQTDSSVFAAVRAAARPMTVEELKERGVAEVRSIKMGHVCDVLEQAIHETLMERAVQGGGAGGFAGETRERFVALLQGKAQATPELSVTDSATRELRRLNADLDQKRTDIARDQRRLAQGVHASAEDNELERSLREQFRRHATSEMTLGELEDFVVESSIAGLRRERLHVREAELAARQSDTRFLERRIQKLKDLLEETERKAPVPDQGLAAGHRDVEGLDPRDKQFDKKMNLLKGVFDENAQDRQQLRKA